MFMMHPSCRINTSNNFYDQSRVEDYYYYYYPSPTLFPSSPSLLLGENNIEAEFFQGFLENHHQMSQQQNPQENNTNNNDNYDDDNKNNDNKSRRVGFDKINSPKKSISKKDRHTKIDTAQGPRDRRMRLSLSVARKFFDLQDMLGFDKASKTVEWLLEKSLSAINELSRSFQQQVGANSSVSPTSEIEMDELSSTSGKLGKGRHSNKNSEKTKPSKKLIRPIRPLAKKSRDKARERARERTKKKMSTLQKRQELVAVDGNGSSLVGAGSWIPSTACRNLLQSDGIIPELTGTELDHLSGNLGEAIIW